MEVPNPLRLLSRRDTEFEIPFGWQRLEAEDRQSTLTDFVGGAMLADLEEVIVWKGPNVKTEGGSPRISAMKSPR